MSAPAQTGEMVLRDVVRYLRIPAKAVHPLVAEGLLPRPRRVCAYIFAADAIRAFREQFSYDTEVARQHELPDEIRRKLAAARVRPVATIRTKSGTAVAVYRLADVNRNWAGVSTS